MWWSSAANASSVFMPPQGTAVSTQIDGIYSFLLISSVISFIILIGGMCWFVFKYKRRSSNDKTAYITHNHTLEFLWSFIPFCLFMFVFAWGWIVYHQMRAFPENALEVHVVAKKWAWRFLYKNGKEVTAEVNDKGEIEPPTMVVPVGRPVKLIMSSEKMNPAKNDDPYDRPVLHSFYIPAFRVKQDVVPGRFTALWFQPEKVGDFWVFCAEYCGASHYDMKARVRVVSQDEFDGWLTGEARPGVVTAASTLSPMAQKGKQLYASKACIGCHTLNGSPGAGPTFKGLFGKTETTDKGQVKVDENYLRESILNANAQIVNGYAKGQMPQFAGTLSDEEVLSLIEFIKTIK